jgi:hypothetical protein
MAGPDARDQHLPGRDQRGSGGFLLAAERQDRER